MHRLIDFSLRNKFLVLILTAVLVGLGVNAMLKLPIDAVPDVSPNQVMVITQAPGLGPVEVEKFVTFPVETAMSGLPGITDIRSISRFGLSSVSIYFEEGLDIYFVRRLVMERLPEAREAIPEGFGTPAMGPISTGLGEIYQFEVSGKGYSPMDLRSILDWDIGFKLRSVPGVVEVNGFGGELKTYEVQIDPDKLVSYNVSLDQVFKALEENNRNAGGAYIEKAQEQYVIRGEGLVETLGRRRQHRRGGRRRRHAGLHQESRADGVRRQGPAGRGHARRPRRGRHRRRADAHGRELARRRRAGQGEDRGDQAVAAARRADRGLLRSHRPRAQDDQDRVAQPDRGRDPRHRRAAACCSATSAAG